MRLIIQTESGEQFETDVSPELKISEVIAELYEQMNWPLTDSSGRGVRAVVDLVDPENPNKTKRLNSEQKIDDAGLWESAILRVSSESIAGVVDERERVRALVADHRDMEELAGWNPKIKFEANTSHAPTRYVITINCASFARLKDDGATPEPSNHHQVEITLGAEYPRKAPQVKWMTPIFHPNVSPETGAVCLGIIMDRYMPGLGLARLVTMLAEMVQYRNFDQFNPLNKTAAEWANNPDHFSYIEDIGGSPFQGPVQELFEKIEKMGKKKKRIEFKQISRKGIYND